MSNSGSAKERLVRRETEFDQKIRELEALKLPIRATIAALHASVDSLRFGNRHDPKGKGDLGKFIAACGRVGYIVNQLCDSPLEPIGANAQNAITAFFQTCPTDMSDLLKYAQLCELMPDVRRGNYEIEEVDKNTFRLFHSESAIYDTEAQDIILADLGVPFLKVGGIPEFTNQYILLAANLPKIDLGQLAAMAKRVAAVYRDRLVEIPLLDDSSMQRNLGFTNREFRAFCTAVVALGEVYSNIGLAFAAEIIEKNQQSDLEANAEMLEWISAYQNSNFVQGLLLTISELSTSVFDKIFRFFSMDLSRFEPAKLADGFSPTFLILGDAVLFCPAQLPMNLSFRNVLFVLNRENPNWFSANVSANLEPCLIGQAINELSKIPGIICRANVNYQGGEIDLVVYSEKDCTCVHVQAKAPLAPQGARMVNAVQDRMLEGVAQIKNFGNLAPQTRNEIVSRAFGRDVDVKAYRKALLVRGSVGTKKIWDALALDQINILNLSILRWATAELCKQSDPVSVDELFEMVSSKMSELRTSCASSWTESSLEFGGTKVIFPSLEYNRNELLKVRTKIFEDAA